MAVAKLEQSTEQKNKNEGALTVTGPTSNFAQEQQQQQVGDGTQDQDQTQTQSVEEVGLQLQLVGQANVNLQAGASVAVANSTAVPLDENGVPLGEYNVSVNQTGPLDVAGDGIDAQSNAVAVAKLEQEAEQKNKNEGTLAVDGPTANFKAQQQQQQTDGGTQTQAQNAVQEIEEAGLQAQLVGQANLNGELGIAVAEASSGDVYVGQSGDLTAGENGIVANRRQSRLPISSKGSSKRTRMRLTRP